MKLESMKMYEWDFAPNCRRVRMFLIEKGLEIERVECITPKIVLNNYVPGPAIRTTWCR